MMLMQLSNQEEKSLLIYHESILFMISFALMILVLFFLKRIFFGPVALNLCHECGSLICSSCSPGDNITDVCAMCQTVKQHRALVSVKDLKLHIMLQEGFAKKRTVVGLVAMVAIPGSGLILKDNTIEGTGYLTGVIFFSTLGIHVNESVMLFSSTFSNSAAHILFFGTAFAIFLLSLIRTIRALME